MTIPEPRGNLHDDPADPRGHGPPVTTAEPPIATQDRSSLSPAPAPAPGVFSSGVGVVEAGTWRLRFGEVTVAGWWLALYLAAVLVYYFAFEAATGQTLGKRLRSSCLTGIRPNRGTARARTSLLVTER